MKTRTNPLALCLAALLTLDSWAGEEPGAPAASPAPEELAADAGTVDPDAPVSRREFDALVAELRRLKLEAAVPEPEYESFGGLGPAASKVYSLARGLSIGGYGEVTYQHFDGARDSAGNLLRDTADFRRFVLYLGYHFSSLIVLNTEFEIEHGREAELEFAYLDFLFSDPVRLRAGLMLVPIGFLNEFHEPPFFHGVNRPELETTLIPTTWREIGLGVHGEIVGLRYKLYVLNGMNVAKLGPNSAASWLRDARGNGSLNAAASGAGVLNLAYALGPVTLGGTAYFGRAGQGLQSGTGAINANVFLGELHAELAWRRLQLRGIYALGVFGDTAAIAERQALTSSQMVGSRAGGGYLEAAYDVLGALRPDSDQSLSPFVRFEALDMQDQLPASGKKNPKLDTWSLTAGLTYRPILNVVAKADFQYRQDGAAFDNSSTTVSLGLGFIY